MISKEHQSFYIDQSKEYFKFLIESGQWTSINEIKYRCWLNNFEADKQYLACKLLSHLLAYSEKDLENLIIETVRDIFIQEIILPTQLKNQFGTRENDMEYMLKSNMQKTLIIPLEATDESGQSGDAMARLLKNKSGFELHYSTYSHIDERTKYKYLIIVDDCIGTGRQFIDFWEKVNISSGKLLRTWCKEQNIKPYYVVAVGYKKALEKAKEKFGKTITIKCADILSERHRIFEKNNYCWEGDNELEDVVRDLTSLLSEKRIGLKGYKGLDFAVLLHNTVPNWSLPLFFKKREDWESLIERKNSND